ncbi:MAG: lipopolysaccharide biosynthesis protein [Acetobacteraceae bacterium]|nr:lipopolysaccharide biosynthesis protein [Pseudomonadota bacterium]
MTSQTRRQAEAPHSIARRAAMGAGWIIAWRVATRNIGLVSTLILVRLLDPSDFGLIALATGFITSIDALSAIGAQDALVRSPKVDRELYDTGFGLTVLRGAVTALLVVAIAWPVGWFFSDMRLTVVMLALAAGTLITAFENIGIVDFRRDLTFHKEFQMQVWSRVTGAMTTIVIAAIWQSYWSLVAGVLVYRTVRLVQSYTMSAYRPKFSLAGWRRIIGFSLWTWAQTLVYQVRDRSDSIVIGRLLGAEKVGEFTVGMELGLLPSTELVEPLGRALFSGFASLQHSAAALANMFVGAVAVGLTLVLPAGVGISMIADPMVRFALGEKWVAAVPVVQILALGGVTSIMTQACANLLNAVGRPSVTFYVVVTSTSAKLAALVVLTPLYGLTGAAVAQLAAIFVDIVLLLAMTLPSVGVGILSLLSRTLRPALATTVMVALLWWFGMAWTPSVGAGGWDAGMDAIGRSAIGAVTYGVTLAVLWVAVGRPDGAERFALSLCGTIVRRVFARTPA